MSGGRADRDGTGGFALFEMVLALMLISLLAALALPGLARPIGMGLLRVSALQVAGLLREDRAAALRSGRTVLTSVVDEGRAVRSGASDARIELPLGARAASTGIRFRPDGHASGGFVSLESDAARIVISVDPVTGAIDAKSD